MKINQVLLLEKSILTQKLQGSASFICCSRIFCSIGRYISDTNINKFIDKSRFSTSVWANKSKYFIMVDYISLVDRMIKMHHSNTDMKYHLEYAETNGEFDNWKSCNHVIKNVGSVDKAFNQLLAIMGLSVPAPPHMIQNL